MTQYYPYPRSVFGFKDIFTLINLGGGLAAILLCVYRAPLAWSGLALIIGWLCGDALDGLVARLTDTSNRFGSEFDTISDHLCQCIAPSVIVFSALKDRLLADPFNSHLLAAAVAMVLASAGSIRHARAATAHFRFPFCYLGLPRTISGLIVVSFCCGHLFTLLPYSQWIAVFLTIGCSVANLSPIPYPTHRGRRLQYWVRWVIFGALSSISLSALLLRDFVFDLAFFWSFGYALVSWIILYPEEWIAFREAVRIFRED